MGVNGPKSGFPENGQKKEKAMKKKWKVPDFSLEISKTIFHPTHPVRKKMRKWHEGC